MAEVQIKRWDSWVSLLLKVMVVLGVSNHFYDPVRHQLVYSTGAFIYRFVLHLGSFIVIVMNSGRLQVILQHLIGERSFLSELSAVCLYVHLAGVISSLASKLTSRGKGTQPLNELLGLRIKDSISAEELSAIQKQAWRLFILQSILAVIMVLSSFMTVLTHCLLRGALIAPSVGLCILQIEIAAFYHRFSLTVLLGGCLFKALNVRLSRAVQQINASQYVSRRKSRMFRKKLIAIGCMHTRLLNLMVRLKDIDQSHMLVMLATAFFYQVWAVFFSLVAFMGLFGEVCFGTLFSSTGFTVLGAVFVAMTLHICGECVEACNSSGSILRTTTFTVMDRCLERDIERLSFQFAREKLRLTICGMFDLDAYTAPGMMKAVALYIILLAQVAYNELR